MANETPNFWWEKTGFLSTLLQPAAWVYGWVAQRNMETKVPPQINLPVLCVGNFTLGGAGKTPVAIALARAVQAAGLKPGVVMRGFGGSVRGPHKVDVTRDRARDVGDEALLLAAHADVVVDKDRYRGAQVLAGDGCDFIVMDDGFQSRRLYADYSLLVVDAMRGIGNGLVFPAGPLRAPLITQLAYSDGVLIMGEGAKGDEAVRFAARAARPVDYARSVSSAQQPVAGTRFLAFAGIGNPQKFFAGIEAAGGIVVQTRTFADHHFFNTYDIADIIASVKANNLVAATTAKDYVRLKTDRLDQQFEQLYVFDVDVVFRRADFCKMLIEETIARYKERCLR